MFQSLGTLASASKSLLGMQNVHGEVACLLIGEIRDNNSNPIASSETEATDKRCDVIMHALQRS